MMVYLVADISASLRYEGYSYVDQTLSELSAVGAPTRTLWVSLAIVYHVLMAACGIGIWKAADGKRRLQVVAVCVVMVGLLGIVWPFAPTHQREILASGQFTLSDTLHVILVTVDSLLFVIAAAFGTGALGKPFKRYSIITIVIVVIAGVIAGGESSRIQAGDPTPWLGIWERLAVYGSLLWNSVLAITLWRREARLQEADRDSVTPGS